MAFAKLAGMTSSPAGTHAVQLPFELAAVVSIVREAAQLALELQGRCAAEIKPDNTLVTAADRELEGFLGQRLAQLAPTFSFLGEETGLTGDPDAPCWVIDPIDGTTNFVRDLPLWCISVGLVWRGRAVLGVLAVPPQNELFYAATGQGAWMERAGTVRRLQTLDQGTLIQEDLIACNTSVEEVVEFASVPCRLRNLGSLAYHLTLLARGTVCASLAHYHKLYDIAAGICLCEEAGCEANYLDGQPWTADVTAGKQRVPLQVAPPQVMKVLLERLSMREQPWERGAEDIIMADEN
jgi:fructose-1,6-bisphosphatase/inositol monophosphatase family enzyme